MNREQRLYQILSTNLRPEHLIIENESSQHNVPEGSESHFKCIIVSDAFDGLSAVKRHQRIYQFLSDEFESGLHALSLHCFLPHEWSESEAEALQSPDCHQKS